MVSGLSCVICGATFSRPKNIAKRAKVCTTKDHACKGDSVKVPGRKDKYIACIENCCLSQYKAGQSKQFMEGTLEKRKYFEEQGELLKALKFLDRARRDVALAIRLAASCGLRVGEIGLIRKEDFSLDDEAPVIYCPTLKRKGRPKRTIDLEAGIAEDLKKYIEETDLEDSSPVFPIPKRTLQHWFEKIQKLAGCKTIRPFHSLRHTHNTRLAEMGTDPRYTQQRAGWATLEMYKVYAHMTDAMRKKIASKLPKV